MVSKNQNINCAISELKKISSNYIMNNKNNININQSNENIKMENSKNNNSKSKNNLSANYIMTSRKSILRRNNKNERSKPVVYKRENNLTKEEVKERLKTQHRINKHALSFMDDHQVKNNNNNKITVNKFKSGKFAGLTYKEIMEVKEIKKIFII